MSTKPPAEAPEAPAASRTTVTRQIDEAFEEASKLAGSALAPAEFYQQFLNITLSAIAAPAGAIWLRTPQGFLQIACQVNLDKVGLDNKRGGRQCHNEILRQVFQAAPPRPVMIEPQGRLTGLAAEPGAVPAANLTDHWALFAPIVNPDKSAFGLLEVFQEGTHDPRMFPTFLNYAFQMAGYASQYHSFSNARQSSGLEKVFSQVETFAKQVHGSLNPTEVAYHVANEGRRLIECDRLCVGIRHGSKVTVEAVSGADVVEKSSTHVRRMKALFDAVLNLGEKLVYKGEKDEGLPPDLSHALDDYLGESQPKLLVVLPIRDDREKDLAKRARSVLLMESFNPPEQTEPLVQRLDVVAKHAAPALYNAAELRRIPFGFIWRPLGQLQNGLGGKNRFYAALAAVAVAALLLTLVLVPYPLKTDAKGEFGPEFSKNVYSPTEGEVTLLLRGQGERVAPGAPVVGLYSPMLQEKYSGAEGEALTAEGQVGALDQMISKGNLPTADELRINQELSKYKAASMTKRAYLRDLQRMYNMDPSRPGHFFARADDLDASVRRPGADWTVLSSDNQNELKRKTVKPNEPLVRLGYTAGPWRVELKIPQRNMGHILQALSTDGQYQSDKGRRYLDVDVLLASAPETSYPGRLYADDIAKEAIPNRDDHNQSEPVVQAYVRVDTDDRKIPRELFVAGQEVHTRVRCGSHALGYSLFHGVWEWFYEKVIFFI